MRRLRWSLLLAAFAASGCGGGAATGTDASFDSAGDAASCNAAAVTFPQGGTLAPGTLCDELYACADDAAGAARIEAAAPRFSCAPGSEPGSGCTAYTCAFRDPAGPSTLDASEIGELCALTVLAPTPFLRCTVFVNAR
jgi:hypothetical protein